MPQGPSSKKAPPPRLWSHALIRLDPSWSNHFLKVCQLATKPLTHETSGDNSDPRDNGMLMHKHRETSISPREGKSSDNSNMFLKIKYYQTDNIS
jgi:hypothetical protein